MRPTFPLPDRSKSYCDYCNNIIVVFKRHGGGGTGDGCEDRVFIIRYCRRPTHDDGSADQNIVFLAVLPW